MFCLALVRNLYSCGLKRRGGGLKSGMCMGRDIDATSVLPCSLFVLLAHICLMGASWRKVV